VRPLARRFYRPDSRVVAPLLLNKVLVVGDRRGRIVEAEAYAGAEDPGSHAYRGPRRRNLTMFGPPGHLYVYFTYGMHWCACTVTNTEGVGQAVLLRAAAPLSGMEAMRPLRPRTRRDRDLCRGPARLCQAFSLTGEQDGADLTVVSPDGPWIGDDGTPPPVDPGVSSRIGVTKGAEHEWRWFVRGDPNVSR
jgi:DNA-3-methyladenine glycosylase